MSVVGFDFGNHKCVVAVARRRGIDVLQVRAQRDTRAHTAVGELFPTISPLTCRSCVLCVV